MKYYKSLILLFLSICLVGCNQKIENSEINEYITKSKYYYNHYDAVKSIEYAKLAYNLAKESGNKQKLAEACEKISAAASVEGLYEEALLYNKEGVKNCPNSDIILKNSLKNTEAYILHHLGFFDEALRIYSEIENDLKKMIDNPIAVELLTVTYVNSEIIYHEVHEVDSTSVSISKLDKIYKNTQLPEKEIFHPLCNYYFYKGLIYIEKPGKLDSAFVLFDTSKKIRNKYNAPAFKEYLGLGDYYLNKGDTVQALDYYKKMFDNIEQNNIKQEEYIEIYKEVAELFGEKGDLEKENEYIKKYNLKIEENRENDKRNVEKVLKLLVDKETGKQIKLSKKLVAISLVLLICIFTIISYYLKQKSRNFILQKEKDENLLLLKKREKEAEILQQKVNESFEEILNMARENHTEFYTRFQEVYPEFISDLNSKNKKLTISELTLASYVYLGFTNKEIADYTFRSIKTIESIRYNLRKKLGLSADINLQNWLMEHDKY